MTYFKNEAEMQTLLEKALSTTEDFASLIENTNYLENFIPVENNIAEKKYFNSFRETLSALYSNIIISQDENISFNERDILKPDFILYTQGREGIVIVELKNIPGPTRQAGTEILAYTSEMKSYIPFIAETDIYYVLVSPYWPTLLKHFIFNEIYWHNKNIICLEPLKINQSIGFNIVNISTLLQEDTFIKIPYQYLTGFQLCLYDKNLYKKDYKRNKLDNHLEQMKASLEVMKSTGNKFKAHGFAILWKDNWSESLAPYSITVINIAAFNSMERFLHGIEEFNELSEMHQKIFNALEEFIPTGHSWSLARIRESAEIFLNSFCDPSAEAYTDWINLKKIMKGRASLLSFKGWGLFEEKFNEVLVEEYLNGNLSTPSDSPTLGLKMIESLINHNYKFFELSFIKDLKPKAIDFNDDEFNSYDYDA